MNWRGRSLTGIRTIVELIGSTTAQTERTVAASYDPNWYERGVRISRDQMAPIPLQANDWREEWSYAVTSNLKRSIEPAADPW